MVKKDKLVFDSKKDLSKLSPNEFAKRAYNINKKRKIKLIDRLSIALKKTNNACDIQYRQDNMKKKRNDCKESVSKLYDKDINKVYEKEMKKRTKK